MEQIARLNRWLELLGQIATFVLHSSIGFMRWRLQRELRRRDVERLEAGGADPALIPRS
jgi:hypothetical protein